jgi:hypothetical protein
MLDQNDARRPRKMPLVFVMLAAVFGIYYTYLGCELIKTRTLPRSTAASDAGLFHLCYQLFGNPVAANLCGLFMILEGAFFIGCPFYLKLRSQQTGMKPTPGSNNRLHDINKAAGVVGFSLAAAYCLDNDAFIMGCVLTIIDVAVAMWWVWPTRTKIP